MIPRAASARWASSTRKGSRTPNRFLGSGAGQKRRGEVTRPGRIDPLRNRILSAGKLPSLALL